MNLKPKTLLIASTLVALFLCSAVAMAEPIVAAISGVIEDGKPIIIYGTDLGGGDQFTPARARIELGNFAIYEDCTSRQVQEAVQWREEEVVINLNLSVFPEGRSIYLFFVNEENVATPGYLLDINPSSDGNGPGQPGKPVSID